MMFWLCSLSQLKKKATLNKYVKTIGLPKKDKKIKAKIKCDVAGWGLTGDKKRTMSDVLRETREKMQFSFECKNIWKTYFNSQQMLCTTFTKKEGGICQVIKQTNK